MLCKIEYLILISLLFIHFITCNIIENIAYFTYEKFSQLSEEFKYRKSSVEQYQHQLDQKLRKSFEQFRNNQISISNNAANELMIYLNRFNKIYNDTTSSLQLQRNKMNEFEKSFIRRPRQIDESLDRFKKFYDESFNKVTQSFQPTFPWFIRFNIFHFIPFDNSITTKDPFSNQIDMLQNNLISQLNSLSQMLVDPSIKADNNIKSLLSEINHFQEELIINANQILKQSQDSIKKTLNKQELLNEKIKLESKLKLLEKNANIWIENKLASLEMNLKSLQEKLSVSNKLYEELLGKKQAELEYSKSNDATLRKVLSLIDHSDKGDI
jgi:hypothetical protein